MSSVATEEHLIEAFRPADEPCNSAEHDAGLRLVDGRLCGACNVCCVVPKIDEPALQKLPGCRCPNAQGDGSCAIYDERPRTCRDFFCGWRLLDWIDERLRPDQAGIFIRLTGDRSLIAGKYPFAMMVTVLSRESLQAPGLVSTLLKAIRLEITSYLIVPGPPGYTSCRIPLNRALAEGAAGNDIPSVMAVLVELHTEAQAHIGKTRPVILTNYAEK